jgi:hypothetical protein
MWITNPPPPPPWYNIFMKNLFVLLFVTLLVPTIIFASSTISTNITTGGNVGIGSTTPYSRLSIDNTSVAAGEELITNGTFTGGTTGWTLGNNVAYGSNNVVITYAGGDPTLSTTFAAVAGRTYLISYTISNVGNGALGYFYIDGENYYNAQSEGNGTYTYGMKNPAAELTGYRRMLASAKV